MSDSIPQILILAISVVFVVVLIGLAFTKLKMGKQIDGNATNSLAEMTSKLDDPERQAYDGAVILGSEVIDLAIAERQKETDGVMVVVRTKAGSKYKLCSPAGITLDAASESGSVAAYVSEITSATDKTAITNDKLASDTKINLNAAFKGYLGRDKDGVINCLYFIQQ